VRRDCNNRCRFCPLAPGVALAGGDEGTLGERVAAARAQGASRLVLAGGEPTLADELIGAVARARALGVTDVVVQTNGRRLAYRGYAASLVAAGVTALEVSLHGPNKAVHDYHTRVPNSFRQTLAGLEHVVSTGASVLVTMTVTRSNVHLLRSMVVLVGSIGVRLLRMSSCVPLGRAPPSLMPRLALARDYLGVAAREAQRQAVSLAVSHLPPCALPESSLSVLVSDADLALGTYGPSCVGCLARSCCCGVAAAYAELYGTAELRPLMRPRSSDTPAIDLERCASGPLAACARG